MPSDCRQTVSGLWMLYFFVYRGIIAYVNRIVNDKIKNFAKNVVDYFESFRFWKTHHWNYFYFRIYSVIKIAWSDKKICQAFLFYSKFHKSGTSSAFRELLYAHYISLGLCY